MIKSHLFRLLLLLSGTVFLTGCGTLSDGVSGVRERIAAGARPVERHFTANSRLCYEAAKTALERMGYRSLRGGAAQGKLEGVSGLTTGDSLRSARQVSVNVALEPALDGGTDLKVLFAEIIENDSGNQAGRATETPLRDTPQYEVFFRGVQQALDAGTRG